MINFISSLPDAGVFILTMLIFGLPMYAGYLIGIEIGLDRGHRAGFDLGKGVGRREIKSGGNLS